MQNKKRITEIDSELADSVKYLPSLKKAGENFGKDIGLLTGMPFFKIRHKRINLYQ